MGITGISVSNSLLKGGANVYFWDDDLNKRKALRKKGYSLINDKNLTNIEYIMPSPGIATAGKNAHKYIKSCLLYTSPSPRDRQKSRMPSSA